MSRETNATLGYVNRIRNVYGHNPLSKLPSGTIRSSTDCVIARALFEVEESVAVFQEVICTEDLTFAKIVAEEFGFTIDSIGFSREDGIRMYNVPLPKLMSTFVENFDEGLYLELIDATNEELVQV